VTNAPKSQSYYSPGLLEELLEESRRKLGNDPDNIVLRLNLAKALSKAGKLEEAVQEFRNCLARADTPETLSQLGKILLKSGNYEEALKAFEELEKKGIRWADCYFHKGLALRAKGDLEAAAKVLSEAITLNPRYREALNERAEILEALDRKDEALHEYKKVIALFFAQYQLHQPINYKYDLSVLFDNPDLVEETVRRLREFVQKFPGFADAHYKLGQALEARGEKEEALLHFRKALEINPRYESARKSFWKRAR
jgi:pentatricopeptide repeat protein